MANVAVRQPGVLVMILVSAAQHAERQVLCTVIAQSGSGQSATGRRNGG